MGIIKRYFKKREKDYQEGIERIVIESLGQLERGELNDSVRGKVLAQEFSKNVDFVELYEEYKKNGKYSFEK